MDSYHAFNCRNRSLEGALDCRDSPSMTKQEFKDECDLNTLMAKYVITGTLPASVSVAKYGDFAGVGDFHECQNVLLVAKAQFDALPSKVRDRFRNDVPSFLDFVQDPKNLDEARALGLLKDVPVEKVAKVEVVNPPTVGKP